MSQLVQLEGKHTAQTAHCAVKVGWPLKECFLISGTTEQPPKTATVKHCWATNEFEGQK